MTELKYRPAILKKRNYTANKLDDKIKKVNEITEYYLKQIEAYDSTEDEIDLARKFTKFELEEKLEKTRKRLEKLLEKQKEMETKGLTQISLTDSDSKPANGSKPKRKYIKKDNSKNSFQTRLQKNKSEEESFRTSFRNNKKDVEWELFPVKE